MAMPEVAQEEANVWDTLKADLTTRLEELRRERKEIALMVEQSHLEVNKLSQRNGSIAARLQQVQAQFDSLPRADIRMAYDSALDTQQRLFVMRGQLEKLQSDQAQLTRQAEIIERVLNAMSGSSPAEKPKNGGSPLSETAERMIQAQEAERLRLSRQMHDGPAQALSNFILQTEIAMRLFDIDQVKARDELGTLRLSATTTFQKVRDFIFELRPMMLDDLGLVPTLKRYVDAFRDQNGLDTRLTVTGIDRRLESYLEVLIFRSVQELLNNASRHSQATMVRVQVDMGDTAVKVTVEDNGKGFDTGILDARRSVGLKVIRERVEMLGGSFTAESALGQGTRIVIHVPAVLAGG